MINAVTHGTVVPPSGRSVRNFRYLVSSFVRHLQETRSATLGYLETIVKGHMLADAIFLPDPGNASRKFRDTEVYFDTPFLLNALRYGGEAQREPCVELLDLLYETGADLRCFAHTRDEIRGVLEACASQEQTSDAEATPGREVLRNFRSMGFSKTDVMMLSNALEKDLEALRIRAVENPPTRSTSIRSTRMPSAKNLRGPSTTRDRSRSPVTSTLYRPSCVCAGEDVLSDLRSVEPCS